jgi:hypothetical protein
VRCTRVQRETRARARLSQSPNPGTAYVQATSLFDLLGDPYVSGITAALRATGFANGRMQTRNRLTFAALCAIARHILEQERSIDDAEWKERIKCRITRERRAYPRPEELSAVLSAVEAALVKRWGPRP